MKQLLEDIVNWKTLAVIIGIIISLSTIMSWKFFSEAQSCFATKNELEKSELRTRDSLLEIKSDIREMKIDIREISKVVLAK